MVEFAGTLPQSIERLVELGIRTMHPSKVILFGSRARGDATPGSDYDLAFVFSPDRSGTWARFVADLSDSPVTLLPTDLVDWNQAPPSLKDRIVRDGMTLYEEPTGQ
jgi:uncharacterized protein